MSNLSLIRRGPYSFTGVHYGYYLQPLTFAHFAIKSEIGYTSSGRPCYVHTDIDRRAPWIYYSGNISNGPICH
jgi:hypothetical protein